jgi:MFS family permease
MGRYGDENSSPAGLAGSGVKMSPGEYLHARHLRRVGLASLVGSIIEFYDFFLYAFAASLIFGPKFFPQISSTAGTLASLGTFGAGILARPVGGMIFGHFGDRSGRKRVLVTTLWLAGGSTFLVGLLPSYQQIGLTAPVLLSLLRVLQGLGIGGEWGGAVLLSTEHAPPGRRTLFASFTQMGNPIGLICALAVLGACRGILSPADFLAWAWRIPFLLSAALVLVGVIVRRHVFESPEFERVRSAREIAPVPLGAVAHKHLKALVLGTLISTPSPAIGLLIDVYLVSVGQRLLHESANRMLWIAAIASLGILTCTWLSAALSDRFGTGRIAAIGFLTMVVWSVPFFVLFQSGSFVLLAIGFFVFGGTVGMVNGPQSRILVDLFPVPLRYSGISFAFQLAAIFGGVAVPIVSAALLASTHSVMSLSAWTIVIAIVGLAALLLVPRNALRKYEPAIG